MTLLGFIIWAYVGKVDIVSKGTAIVQGKSDMSTIRTQIVGVIENVSVHSGDKVKRGHFDSIKTRNYLINKINLNKLLSN